MGELAASVVTVRFFGPARTVFGARQVEVPGRTVEEAVAGLLEGATADQAELVARCGRWVNGEPAGPATPLWPGDELALLPPVSGGCGWWP